jgi:hypothetical protein
VNVAIVNRGSGQLIVRYEIHRAGPQERPPEQEYFDEAWDRAIADRLVDPAHREDYDFQLQLPKNLYESSQ